MQRPPADESLFHGAGFQLFLIAGKPTLDRICSTIQRRGFDVVDACRVGNLSPRDLGERAERKLGNGPAEGDDATVIVAIDLEPRRPNDRELALAPGADNSRAVAWTHRYQKLVLIEEHIEVESGDTGTRVVASRNTAEGVRWLHAALPSEMDRIRREIQIRVGRYRHPFEMVASLTRFGDNAKIDLVRHGGGLAVVKTFRPGREAYLEQEIAGLKACEDLGAPRLVLRRDMWVMTEYLGTGARSAAQVAERRGILPLDVSKRIFGTARRLYESGYAHMDFQPGNVLIDEAGAVRLIDFDRFHKYDCLPDSFERSFDVAGPPDGFEGPLPNRRPPTYRRRWQSVVGLSLDSLLHEPAPLQHSRRAYRRMRNRFPAIDRVDRVLRG